MSIIQNFSNLQTNTQSNLSRKTAQFAKNIVLLQREQIGTIPICCFPTSK